MLSLILLWWLSLGIGLLKMNPITSELWQKSRFRLDSFHCLASLRQNKSHYRKYPKSSIIPVTLATVTSYVYFGLFPWWVGCSLSSSSFILKSLPSICMFSSSSCLLLIASYFYSYTYVFFLFSTCHILHLVEICFRRKSYIRQFFKEHKLRTCFIMENYSSN